MAVIDLKESTIRFVDGTLATATIDSAPADSDVTFTAKSTHQGSKRISVIFTDPGMASQAISVTVTDEQIDVSLATDGMSMITSTANDVKSAVDGDVDAAALVTVTVEGAGTGVVEANAETFLVGHKSLDVTIGEGNLTYSEHKTREFRLDRGILDTVRNADQEPMDVTLDFTFEFLSTTTGDTVPTVEEALKKEGLASTWVTTSTDPCQPFCVNLEIINHPDCGGLVPEIITFEEFYYETLDHDASDGSVSISARCNREEAVKARRSKTQLNIP